MRKNIANIPIRVAPYSGNLVKALLKNTHIQNISFHMASTINAICRVRFQYLHCFKKKDTKLS